MTAYNIATFAMLSLITLCFVAALFHPRNPKK